MEEPEQLIGEYKYGYRGGKIVLYKYSDIDSVFYEVETEIHGLLRCAGDYSTEDEALEAGKADIDTYYLALLRAVTGE